MSYIENTFKFFTHSLSGVSDKTLVVGLDRISRFNLANTLSHGSKNVYWFSSFSDSECLEFSIHNVETVLCYHDLMGGNVTIIVEELVLTHEELKCLLNSKARV
jgi:hypothetical protein